MKLKLNIEYTEYNMSSLGNLNFLQQSRSPKAYKKGYFHNFHFAFVEVTSFLCLAGEELRQYDQYKGFDRKKSSP